jgi:hypothetical protein
MSEPKHKKGKDSGMDDPVVIPLAPSDALRALLRVEAPDPDAEGTADDAPDGESNPGNKTKNKDGRAK